MQHPTEYHWGKLVRCYHSNWERPVTHIQVFSQLPFSPLFTLAHYLHWFFLPDNKRSEASKASESFFSILTEAAAVGRRRERLTVRRHGDGQHSADTCPSERMKPVELATLSRELPGWHRGSSWGSFSPSAPPTLERLPTEDLICWCHVMEGRDIIVITVA